MSFINHEKLIDDDTMRNGFRYTHKNVLPKLYNVYNKWDTYRHTYKDCYSTLEHFHHLQGTNRSLVTSVFLGYCY